MPEEHKNIAMKSETIDVHIGRQIIRVDCKFTFENDGPECRAKMGFPDMPFDAGKKSFPFFFSYKSYVNGVEAKTQTEQGKDGYDDVFWHTQVVEFPANSTVSVEDIYTIPPGLSVDYGDNFSKVFCYLLHTGASWHGKIETAQFNVTFDPAVVRSPVHVIDSDEGSKIQPKDRPANMVVYESTVKPAIVGDKICFKFSNIEPTEDDNLAIEFGSLNKKQTAAYYTKVVQSFIETSRCTLSVQDRALLNKYVKESVQNTKNELGDYQSGSSWTQKRKKTR